MSPLIIYIVLRTLLSNSAPKHCTEVSVLSCSEFSIVKICCSSLLGLEFAFAEQLDLERSTMSQFWASWYKKRQGQTGKIPVEGHKDAVGLGAPPL